MSVSRCLCYQVRQSVRVNRVGLLICLIPVASPDPSDHRRRVGIFSLGSLPDASQVQKAQDGESRPRGEDKYSPASGRCFAWTVQDKR